MPSFMLVYKGEATDLSEMSTMEAAEVINGWTKWMQEVGDALADVGSPFGPSTSLVDDGTTGTASSLTGYSVVTAGDLDEARRLADGHPYLSEGKGNLAIDIYELMPAPFDQ